MPTLPPIHAREDTAASPLRPYDIVMLVLAIIPVVATVVSLALWAWGILSPLLADTLVRRVRYGIKARGIDLTAQPWGSFQDKFGDYLAESNTTAGSTPSPPRASISTPPAPVPFGTAVHMATHYAFFICYLSIRASAKSLGEAVVQGPEYLKRYLCLRLSINKK